MPDRSSHQGLPEHWNHGSHAARGSFPGAAAGTYGAPPAGTYGAPAAGKHNAAAPGTYEGAAAGTYGAAAAGPFGDADRFGSRAADPFGPAPTAAFGPMTAGAETARAEAEPPASAIGDRSPGEIADARSFLGALFDFGFTSFVMPKVIKVLYLLIVIGTVVSALVFTIVVFKASVMFGFLTLVFGDPLFILIVLAIYRIILEFFVVTFRLAEDIRILRERGGPS